MNKFFLLVLILIIVGGSYYWLAKKPESVITPHTKEIKAKFAILSDTHSDSENTRKALSEAKAAGAEFIMNTGDLTTVGSTAELTAAKKDFDSIGLEYHLAIGDHDLYNSAGVGNFEKIIGKDYYSIDKLGVHLLVLDTADTSVGIDATQMNWLRLDLEANKTKKILMFMHLPLYHPTNPRTIWEKEGNNLEVKKQAEEVIGLLKKYKVLVTFAGDHHLSSDYTEPESSVKMYVVGAVTRERNLQKPRFDMVTIYADGTVQVDEIVI